LRTGTGEDFSIVLHGHNLSSDKVVVFKSGF
jgi:hypothetical protein